MKGKLYLVPITLGDFNTINKTLPDFNIEIIHQLSIFIVENIRTARRFLSKTEHPVEIDQLTFFELGKHTPVEQIGEYFKPLEEGKNIGLISEAGTPCIADPGSVIVSMAHNRKIEVIPLVGPNSIILALMASGFNGQNFAFHGYLPVDKKQLAMKLKELENQVYKNNQTQIFIETPFRNERLFNSLLKLCNPGTRLSVAINLTLESQRIMTLTIQDWLQSRIDLHKKPAVFLLYK